MYAVRAVRADGNSDIWELCGTHGRGSRHPDRDGQPHRHPRAGLQNELLQPATRVRSPPLTCGPCLHLVHTLRHVSDSPS